MIGFLMLSGCLFFIGIAWSVVLVAVTMAAIEFTNSVVWPALTIIIGRWWKQHPQNVRDHHT